MQWKAQNQGTSPTLSEFWKLRRLAFQFSNSPQSTIWSPRRLGTRRSPL